MRLLTSACGTAPYTLTNYVNAPGLVWILGPQSNGYQWSTGAPSNPSASCTQVCANAISPAATCVTSVAGRSVLPNSVADSGYIMSVTGKRYNFIGGGSQLFGASFLLTTFSGSTYFTTALITGGCSAGGLTNTNDPELQPTSTGSTTYTFYWGGGGGTNGLGGQVLTAGSVTSMYLYYLYLFYIKILSWL